MSRAARLLPLPLLIALSAILIGLPDDSRSAPAPVPRHRKRFTNSIGMKLVLIPKGKFLMGSPTDEMGRHRDEGPQHEVEITRTFYLGAYTVTQAQYNKVMGSNPSYFCSAGSGRVSVRGMDTSDFPVESVSWHDAVAFCKKLSARPAEKGARRVYRLPSEAEWEYACRAGTTTPYNCGNTLTTAQANFRDSPLGRTAKVGSYKANAWGLFDMHGNVFQWCSDWYERNYYPVSPKKDPAGAKAGGGKVVRGGAWRADSALLRAAFRACPPTSYAQNDVGLRIACGRR
jgi:formylglycine-generating enzyme required for sulfatase activity